MTPVGLPLCTATALSWWISTKSTWHEEKALNRRAALLAREMRARFPHMAEWAYLRTLAVARLTIETLAELERQRGGVAKWEGAL